MLQDVIEARYQAYIRGGGSEIVILEMGNTFYEINVRVRTQINLTNFTATWIKRRTYTGALPPRWGPPNALSYAHLFFDFCRVSQCLSVINFVENHLPKVDPEWFPMDTESPGVFDIIPLMEYLPEYQEIFSRFFNTMRDVGIRRIYRVQNILMWKRFNA